MDRPRRLDSQDGLAIVVVVFAAMLMSALGGALILNTTSETLIASNFRIARETDHAADAALELAVAGLAATPDWNLALAGVVQSDFADGSPSGMRRLPNGAAVDLSDVVNRAGCGLATSCTDAELNAVTAERPWGANNPRWTLYAYGPISQLSSTASGACCYLTVLVGDDPSENDGNPRVDASDAAHPGAGVVVVRAESFGRRGSHARRDATLSRRDGGLRVVSWRRPVP